MEQKGKRQSWPWKSATGESCQTAARPDFGKVQPISIETTFCVRGMRFPSCSLPGISTLWLTIAIFLRAKLSEHKAPGMGATPRLMSALLRLPVKNAPERDEC